MLGKGKAMGEVTAIDDKCHDRPALWQGVDQNNHAYQCSQKTHSVPFEVKP